MQFAINVLQLVGRQLGRIPYRHNNYAKKRSAHLTATKKQSTDVKPFSMHFQQIIFDLKYIRGLDGGGHF